MQALADLIVSSYSLFFCHFFFDHFPFFIIIIIFLILCECAIAVGRYYKLYVLNTLTMVKLLYFFFCSLSFFVVCLFAGRICTYFIINVGILRNETLFFSFKVLLHKQKHFLVFHFFEIGRKVRCARTNVKIVLFIWNDPKIIFFRPFVFVATLTDDFSWRVQINLHSTHIEFVNAYRCAHLMILIFDIWFQY